MRNSIKQAPALKPRTSLIAPVSPCVFYALHAPSSGTISDALGNGPDFTMSSGTTDSLGRYAPAAPNTTIEAMAGADAYLFSLLSLSASFGQILLGFDYQNSSAAIPATMRLLTAGISDQYAGAAGSIEIGMSTTENVSFSIRGAGNEASVYGAATGAGLAVTTRVAVVIDIRPGAAAKTVDVDFYTRSASGDTHTSLAGISTGGAVGTLEPYGSSTDYGFTIGARRTAASTYDQRLNGTAGDGASIKNLLMMRRAENDATLAQLSVNEMFAYENEFPAVLNGK